MKLTKEVMLSIFTLAGIKVLNYWELPNEYWPSSATYDEVRKNSPWWLVKTTKGLIKIGWRKKVINIDWSDTGINVVVTEDEVTKDEQMVHAYSVDKAVTYLKSLAVEVNREAVVDEASVIADLKLRIKTLAKFIRNLQHGEQSQAARNADNWNYVIRQVDDLENPEVPVHEVYRD